VLPSPPAPSYSQLDGHPRCPGLTAAPASAQPRQIFTFLDLAASEATPRRGAVHLRPVLTDVGPTPYYIEIFDHTTGTMVKECAPAQPARCRSATTTDDAHLPLLRFPLWNDGTSAGGQQSRIPRSSSAGPAVLNGPGAVINNGTRNLTANASYNVARRPTTSEIFDHTTGTLLAACGSGNGLHRIGPDQSRAATPCRTPTLPTSPSTAPRTLRQSLWRLDLWTVQFIGPPC